MEEHFISIHFKKYHLLKFEIINISMNEIHLPYIFFLIFDEIFLSSLYYRSMLHIIFYHSCHSPL
jgi:hypothetical protein